MTNLLVFEQTDVGRVRDHNEDCLRTGIISGPGGDYHLWVVADGMGGGVRGEDASAIAVETLFDELGDGRWRDPKEALTRAFQLANTRVHRMGTADGALSQSAAGTTVTAALVHDASATTWIANVGDSRAYLGDAHGLRQITEDHSYVAGLVSAGIITEDEAAHASDRNVLTRAVGTEPKVTVDTFGPEQLQPGQRLLLCSDGLHGFVEPARLDQMMRELPLAELPQALIDAANEGGGRDNISAIVGALADPGATVLMPAPVMSRRDRKMLLIAAGAAGGAIAAIFIGLGLSGALGGRDGSDNHGGGVTPTADAHGEVVSPATATPTATATATSTATPTATSAATLTSTRTASANSTSLNTVTPPGKATPAETPTPPTPSATPTSTASPSPTATSTATPTSATPTPSPTREPTQTPTPMCTPTPTPTDANSQAADDNRSRTPCAAPSTDSNQ